MKPAIASLLFAFGLVSLAQADQFVLKLARGDDAVVLSLATVRVTRDATVVFEGRTDRLGRITVNLPPGQFQAAVIWGGRNLVVLLTVNGQPQLKTVLAN